jgi:sialate O-acetylesterase
MRPTTLKGFILLCVWFRLADRSALADVRLPAVISDNMVLQQGMKIPIWGKADAGEQVTVTFEGFRASVAANSQGQWKVEIGPLKEGGPFEMPVSGKNTVTLRNVLVGEVWICSGQSNMEMAIDPKSPSGAGGVVNAQQEIASAKYPKIRWFWVKKVVTGRPQQDTEGHWVETSPQTVGAFSAVGYFFGRELHKTLGAPIGMIEGAWGGTPAESWTSREALQFDSELRPILEDSDKKLTDYPKLLEEFRRKLGEWERPAREAEAQGNPVPAQPKMPTDPRSDPLGRASGLFNGMIMPLIPYAIRGVIWYQGESNADRPDRYLRLFPAMIQDWRRAWGEGDFPFLLVQLANFQVRSLASWGYGSPDDPLLLWPELREAQVMTLSVPNTGMAVTIDIGEGYNVHPKNKQEVGRRLALAALHIAYGQQVVYSGPIYRSMSVESDEVRLKFDHVDGGLMAKGSDSPEGFEIAGEDHKFVPAHAKIDADTVVLRSATVSHPVAARYAWADDPHCNLYNKSGLPASPFRSDKISADLASPGKD